MALGVPERPERLLFRGIIGCLKIADRGRIDLAARTLEAFEVRTLKPGIGTAQVFVGAQQCLQVSTQNEQRGCLSIYNPSLNKVVIGTDPGPVTGIAPVTGRNEVYVIENGELRIWSTVSDALLPSSKQFDISGNAEDVVIVD